MSELNFKDVLAVFKSAEASTMPEAVLGLLLKKPEIDREKLDPVVRLLRKGSGDNIAQYAGAFQEYMLGSVAQLPKLPPIPAKGKASTVDEFNEYYAGWISLSEDQIRRYFDTILVDEEHGAGSLVFDAKLPEMHVVEADGVTTVRARSMEEIPLRPIVLRSFEDARKWTADVDSAIGFKSNQVYYTMNATIYASVEGRAEDKTTPAAILGRLNAVTLRDLNVKGMYVSEVMSRVSMFVQPQFEGLFNTFFRK